MFSCIFDAKRGLTLPVAAVVADVTLQVTTSCTSLVSDPVLSCYDSKVSVALVVGVVLPSAWSNIGSDAILIVLPT